MTFPYAHIINKIAACDFQGFPTTVIKEDFDDVVPFAGLGWNTVFGKDGHWGFIFELGVIFQGTPEANLSITGPLKNDAAFQANLAKEERNLQDELDNYEYYPVIALGLSYRF